VMTRGRVSVVNRRAETTRALGELADVFSVIANITSPPRVCRRPYTPDIDIEARGVFNGTLRATSVGRPQYVHDSRLERKLEIRTLLANPQSSIPSQTSSYSPGP
jgi:hypothetical protein